MLIYLIDAFNLIHKIEPILDSATPHSDLVRHMIKNSLTGSHTNKAIVVFDGHEPKGQLIECPFDIVFSKNRTADDVIKGKVSAAKNKRQLVVVSDDNSVRNHARGEGAKVMGTMEFLKHIPKRKGQDRTKDEKAMDEDKREKLTKELENIWLAKQDMEDMQMAGGRLKEARLTPIKIRRTLRG